MTLPTINTQKVLAVDIDDTLFLWNRSDYPEGKKVVVDYQGRTPEGIAHQKNVNLLIKFYQLGYTIIAWSRTGADWAEAVCKALELEPYIMQYQTKPMFYLDDKPADRWMERLWRNPITGESEV